MVLPKISHCPNLGIWEQVKILLNELGLTSSLN
jgi:hypothetical protein